MDGVDTVSSAKAPLCATAVSEVAAQNDIAFEPELFKLYVVSAGLEKLSLKAARRLMKLISLPWNTADSKSSMKKQLTSWVKSILKGKTRSHDCGSDRISELAKMREMWPQTVSETLKTKFVSAFKDLTSKRKLATVTCASCSA